MAVMPAPAPAPAPTVLLPSTPAVPQEVRRDDGIGTPSGQRVRLYVWEVPVRLTHWLTFFSIVVLSVTGGYIASPFLLPPGGAVMSTVFAIHMGAAFVFLASGILRTYWLFAGNRFSSWRAFVPTNRRHLAEIIEQAKWYAFLRKDLPRVVGHNALASGTYLVVFFLFLVQTLTGFALASVHGNAIESALFGWVPLVTGGIQGMRLIHHLIMWVIIGFAIHHVYSAVLVDHWEKTGVMSSIFGGYKFITRRDVQAARDGGMDLGDIER